LIDLGPEGGERGGEIVATGTPEEVAAVPGSYTGRFLADLVTPAASVASGNGRGRSGGRGRREPIAA
jgi:excinuclease ABC subunit A